MGSTTVLLWAAGLSVAVLAVLLILTSKWIPSKHVFPSAAVYFATAASISLSLASPRLTSTSVTDVAVDNGLAGAIARGSTFAAVGIVGIGFLLSARRGWHVPALAGALIVYGIVGFFSALVNGQPLEFGAAYVYAFVAGIALTSSWTFSEAIPVVRRCLRAHIWLSLALMFIAPAMAFWDVQGRELLGVKQLAGVTTHPNGLGTVAAVAIFVELFTPDGARKPRRVHLLAALVVLVLTQSRGAWLAVGIGLLFWLIGRAKNTTIGIAAPLVVGVMLGSIALQNQIFGWLEGTTNQRDFSTLNGRTLIWEQALAPVSESPWLGYGPLVFDVRFRWQALGLADDAGHSNSHNQIIQTLVERGWVGLVVLAMFVVLLMRAAWQQPLKFRGPAFALAMVFVSRFAVETPVYVSTASLNATVLILLVTLLTARPDQNQTVTPQRPRLAARRRKPSSALENSSGSSSTTLEPRLVRKQ